MKLLTPLNRVICRLALLGIALGAIPVAQAQFTYTNEGGAITIVGYTGPVGAVTIPDTIDGLPVTRIGDYAFYASFGLTSITIPDSVIRIGDWAFWACSGLTSVTIPNSVTRIGDWAFRSCYGLTSITIPSSVTSIGYGAFYGCTGLKAITVDVFNPSYGSVEGVLFNKSQTLLVQYPGGQAGSYTIPNSVTNIGNSAFSGCSSLTDVIIPDSVTRIGDSAFSYCSGLASVAIPNGVTSIGGGAFSYSGLTSVTIPDSVTSLGNEAFSYCSGLASVTIGNRVASIGNRAFYGCSGLTSITIPSSVTSIGYGAFSGCTGLKAISVDAFNPSYSSVEGVLFNKSQTLLVQYPGGKAGSYTIPDSVTHIGDGTFYGCTGLTNVIIGNSVAKIGDVAFSGCTGLTRVIIPGSVTRIGYGAFQSCSGLTGVYFQGNAPEAEFDTFSDTPATLYYLPGATGWGATFADRPTALWFLPNPLILTSSPGPGVHNNEFGFTLSWATHASVVVETCADLAHPDWTAVGTNTLTDGLSYFSDPEWSNHPNRFYRLRSP